MRDSVREKVRNEAAPKKNGVPVAADPASEKLVAEVEYALHVPTRILA